MAHDSPSKKAIVRIAHVPAIRYTPQEGSLSTRAISSAPHAKVKPVRLFRALPGNALDNTVVKVAVILASAYIGTGWMVKGYICIRVVWVAGWRRLAIEAQVPLSLEISIESSVSSPLVTTYSSIFEHISLHIRGRRTGTCNKKRKKRNRSTKRRHSEQKNS